MSDGIRRSAVISECRRYRYGLARAWAHGVGRVAFVGLNPSTADGSKDDATIRKCIGFAKRWGFSAMHMLNLFAWRDRHPRGLLDASDPVGPHNDATILEVASRCERVVLAWGSAIPALRIQVAERASLVRSLLASIDGEVGRFAGAPDGRTRHPLMLAYDTPFEVPEHRVAARGSFGHPLRHVAVLDHFPVLETENVHNRSAPVIVSLRHRRRHSGYVACNTDRSID